MGVWELASLKAMLNLKECILFEHWMFDNTFHASFPASCEL